MTRTAASNDREQFSHRPPRAATTPEARENQLIAAAVDLAERQILEGTASAQVITHYLKLGSTRERLEQDKLQEEVLLKQAQREELASRKKVEELYAEALGAMRTYQGESDSPGMDVDFTE